MGTFIDAYLFTASGTLKARMAWVDDDGVPYYEGRVLEATPETQILLGLTFARGRIYDDVHENQRMLLPIELPVVPKKNIVSIEVRRGDDFYPLARRARSLAIAQNCAVDFVFHGLCVRISAMTDLDDAHLEFDRAYATRQKAFGSRYFEAWLSSDALEISEAGVHRFQQEEQEIHRKRDRKQAVVREYEICYFKSSGKLYTHCRVTLSGEDKDDVTASFEALRRAGSAPGLSTDGKEFHVIITPVCPDDDDFRHPWLIVAK